jgi:16S rRNA (cytosine1402-N4)-methyltransferase
MSQETTFHTPVMVEEALDLIRPCPPGVVVDATVGGGGHAAAILADRRDVVVVGIDQDEAALEAASQHLHAFGGRAIVRRGRFDDLDAILAATPRSELASPGGISAILFDLGVSSHQLDAPSRGFSYRLDGPIDMRMDQSAPTSAADLVNNSDVGDLVELFRLHGEERFARRIAESVVRHRPITTTKGLAAAVSEAIPAAHRRRGHPARRVFQALRVAVNDELRAIEAALDKSVDIVVPQGRIIVISYHSGEDRIVKRRFRDWSTATCSCAPGSACTCGATPRTRLVTKGAQRPSREEIAGNPRAREARLRAVERLAPQPEEMDS